MQALTTARELPDDALPSRSPRIDGPPVPRAWAEKDPVAARRLAIARAAIHELSREHDLPVENIVTPDYLRRVLWAPPPSRQEPTLLREVPAALAQLGARRWQIELVTPLLVDAIIRGEVDSEVDVEALADPRLETGLETGPETGLAADPQLASEAD